MTDVEGNVNTNSRPSELRITDMRICDVRSDPLRGLILRLDTNQGISGYGDIRDGGSKTYGLLLKSRILGENPCDVDRIFRSIKQFGHHARQGGGVCAIEMALMDLAGKAYGVPAYQLAGGKFRDKILCYCDTPSVSDGRQMGQRLKERMDSGYKFLKMDVGIGLLRDIPDTLIAPPQMLSSSNVMHPFTGIQITNKGIDVLCEYVAHVRDAIGYEIPLAVDHFGHIGVESCIRLGKALDQFALAWYEDMIPWQFVDEWKRLADAVDTPVCTGEDIYLKEDFGALFEQRAIAVAHPDLASSGGILETKKICDMAQEAGVAMAFHMAMSPIAALAAVHCAAASENFMVLENHSVDEIDTWSQMVEGLPVPLIQDGYIQVPEGPGLGFTDVNEEVLRAHLNPKDPGYFESTDDWNDEHAHDRLWS
ncbi:MAG: mandelate racemase/muconate lactonizing enzyme family protein [Gemmatimonadetes bacterium]|jgi:L-alanine-DL-glutamate epimerase-like enolase superfamily enzyme|nr:mandelate racemase/muconate lactonizing enzyme family protein [Gemmatimonadota bacterium]MBT4613402.1 mandelate racemase/muconate lactonizing enzyme family protein [Gemmatimonadota bacterium]MBT5060452.1 mandelate racemase/muconate lactonizing enzyme family protein [Gemmatimonadota bacterium]MBT5142402.1 mandelate racemase/muconate lactonizing enzyme family protein [Gemmatimonadota bacterium]MBT5588220.1 mandelate racemase/muconate lactonizing enzyme family protein [Gemmatimonadota bacterium